MSKTDTKAKNPYNTKMELEKDRARGNVTAEEYAVYSEKFSE